ncbi:hypothetical protein ACB094_02G047100 [Castanea mollissima]
MGMDFWIRPFLTARVIALPLVAAADAPPLSLPSSSMSAMADDVPRLDGIRTLCMQEFGKHPAFSIKMQILY